MRGIYQKIGYLALIGIFTSGLAYSAPGFDSFEDGDYTEGPSWSEFETLGGSASVTSSQSYFGSNSVRLTSDGSGNGGEHIVLKSPEFSASDYSNGFTFSTWVRTDYVGGDRSIFSLHGSTGYIEFRFDGTGDLQLRSDQEGDTGFWSFSSNTWYQVNMTVDKTNNDVDVKMYDTSGNVVQQQNKPATVDFTNVRIEQHDRSSGSYSSYWDLVLYSPDLNTAPSFKSVSFSPETWSNDDQVDFEANVSDQSGSISSVEATVYEGKGSPIKEDLALSQDANGNWTASNLFTVDEGSVYYNVSINATDDAGASTTYETNKFVENVSASWSHSGSADGYRLYSNISSSGMEQVADVGSLSYEHISTALSSGKYVCYEVTAYNQYGESAPSSEDCATIS